MNREGRYVKTEQGTYVRADDPESIASEMTPHSKAFFFDVDQWTVIASTSVVSENAEKEKWAFNSDAPPSYMLRLKLHNERRTFYTLREEGTARITGDFEFDVTESASGDGGGYVRHHQAWQAKHSDDSADEMLSGACILPKDRLVWIVEQLKVPGARLSVKLDMPVFKERIAHDFDEFHMSQDIYLLHNEQVVLNECSLNVIFGPGKTESEQREDELEEINSEFDSPVPPLPQPVVMQDRRMSWIIALLVLLVLVQLLKG